MATTPYVDELVRRIALDDAGVTVDRHTDGLCAVLWPERSQAHPSVLLVREADLAAVVSSFGDEWRDRIWPGSSLDDTGFGCCSSTWRRSARRATPPSRCASPPTASMARGGPAERRCGGALAGVNLGR